MAKKKKKIPKKTPRGLWKFMLEQNAKGKKIPSSLPAMLRQYEAHKLKKKLKKR